MQRNHWTANFKNHLSEVILIAMSRIFRFFLCQFYERKQKQGSRQSPRQTKTFPWAKENAWFTQPASGCQMQEYDLVKQK